MIGAAPRPQVLIVAGGARRQSLLGGQRRPAATLAVAALGPDGGCSSEELRGEFGRATAVQSSPSSK